PEAQWVDFAIQCSLQSSPLRLHSQALERRQRTGLPIHPPIAWIVVLWHGVWAEQLLVTTAVAAPFVP
ncbi:MAG: hypothetical protein ACE5HO_18490, partial [bacterium]